MQVTAKLRYLRIAPRKVRLVADLIRGKKVEEAQKILNFTTKKSSSPILKLLKSAIANAKHNFQIEESNLFISKITIDEGPKFKRWIARARGRADEILKRSSHITIVLGGIKPVRKKKAEKKKEDVLVKKPIEKKEKTSVEKKIIPEQEKPKVRSREEERKPRFSRGIKRIFRRKAF